MIQLSYASVSDLVDDSPGLDPEKLYVAVDADELEDAGSIAALAPEELAWWHTDERGLAWRVDCESDPVDSAELVRSARADTLVLFRCIRSQHRADAVIAVRQWAGPFCGVVDAEWRRDERRALACDPTIARLADLD